jgi:diguanylate cyclase (GGDEF)-like protein/PAS domain S-box-containing protein
MPNRFRSRKATSDSVTGAQALALTDARLTADGSNGSTSIRAITQVGSRWLFLVNALIGAYMIWWVNLGSPIAISDGERQAVEFWSGVILLLSGVTCVPPVSRALTSAAGRQPFYILATIFALICASWVILSTSMLADYWPIIVLTILALSVAITVATPSAIVTLSSLAAVGLTFLVTGDGIEKKLIISVMCFALSGMVISLARGRMKARDRYLELHQTALAAQNMLASFEKSGRGWFWQTDAEGRLLYLSATQADILGLSPETVQGRELATLVAMDHDANDAHAASDRTFAFTLSAGVDFSDVIVRVAADQERWWSLSGMAIHDQKGRFTGFRGSGTDLTEQRKSEEMSRQLAHFDVLTGLANRGFIRRTLEQVLHANSHGQPQCALMLIDLDRFKNVNDTLGHPVGDELLKIVAKRLTRAVGTECQVGRLGGDEFQVVIPSFRSRSALASLADGLIDRLSFPYEIEGASIQIGASVGIAVAPGDGVEANELTRNADLALYAAKAAGKGVHRFFQPDMHAAADERRAIENDLREMLKRGQLNIAYQPVVDSQSEQIVGFEALARWDHPERGSISPAVFIPIAEEIGMVELIGDWVMREACREAAQWPEHLRLAVNLSAKQFEHPGLIASVLHTLAETGLAAERLELELTEGTLLSDCEQTHETLQALSKLGTRLVLDDFGTGYASLGYLRRVPFTKIKIDQTFVRGAADRTNRNSAIIRAIVNLAESLGMETVAEGVETLDEIELIRSLGCSQIQGFVFGGAVTAEVARTYARNAKPPSTLPDQEVEREQRVSLLRIAQMRSGNSVSTVRIKNVSPHGALLEVPGNVALSPSVELLLSDGLRLNGEVRWRKGSRIGLCFIDPIDVDAVAGKPGALAAAMARGDYQAPARRSAA